MIKNTILFKCWLYLNFLWTVILFHFLPLNTPLLDQNLNSSVCTNETRQQSDTTQKKIIKKPVSKTSTTHVTITSENTSNTHKFQRARWIYFWNDVVVRVAIFWRRRLIITDFDFGQFKNPHRIWCKRVKSALESPCQGCREWVNKHRCEAATWTCLFDGPTWTIDVIMCCEFQAKVYYRCVCFCLTVQ